MRAKGNAANHNDELLWVLKSFTGFLIHGYLEFYCFPYTLKTICTLLVFLHNSNQYWFPYTNKRICTLLGVLYNLKNLYWFPYTIFFF